MTLIAGIIRQSGGASEGLLSMLRHSGLPVGAWMTQEETATAAFAVLSHRILPQDKPRGSAFAAGDLFVAGDVRIDNREEVIDRLGLHPAEWADRPDEDVFCAAWIRWQRDALRVVCGGFAVAIRDSRASTLTLIRDHVGERPLHYAVIPAGIAFASMPQVLTGLEGVDTSLDIEYLVASVTRPPSQDGRCSFRNVRRVAPGTLVTWKQGQASVERYWHPLDAPPVRFRRDEEYAEALLKAFDKAVACRLRTTSGIGSQLSGGMDSSSVTATAAGLMNVRALTAFTSVPKRGFAGTSMHGRFSDEGPAASLVAARYGNIRHLLVESCDTDLVRMLETSGRLLGQPVFNPLNQAWANAMYDQARQRGIDVMLTGGCGNSTISFAGLIGFADMFRAGHWWKLMRLAREVRRAGHTSWRGAAYWAAGSYLPMGARRIVSQEMRNFSFDFSPVHPDRLREHGLVKAAYKGFFGADRTSRDFRRHAYNFYDAGVYYGAASAGWGVSVRDPTQDKRLFEYCFAIPIEQYLVGGQTRSLVRRAMKERLPRETLACTTRGLQAADWYLTMGKQLSQLRDEVALICESPTARYVLDTERLQRLVDTWPSSGYEKPAVSNSYHFALSRGIAAGNFIRHMETGRWVN